MQQCISKVVLQVFLDGAKCLIPWGAAVGLGWDPCCAFKPLTVNLCITSWWCPAGSLLEGDFGKVLL